MLFFWLASAGSAALGCTGATVRPVLCPDSLPPSLGYMATVLAFWIFDSSLTGVCFVYSLSVSLRLIAYCFNRAPILQYTTMNKHQLTQSLKDILPTYAGEYPPQLVSYIDSLYLLSLQKLPVLPNKADVARFHLCAYLAVERCQDRFNLPDPLLQRIPVQPRLVEKLLDDLLDKVMGGTASPHPTPTKRPHLPRSLPSKRANVPKVSSPLKRLQSLAPEGLKSLDPTDLRNAASPFNPLGESSLNAKSVPDSPNKVQANKESENWSPLKESPSKGPLKGTPLKGSPLKGSPSKSPFKGSAGGRTPNSPSKGIASPGGPRYVRHLTIADFISFANNFYIPASVTPQMIECFVAQQHKFTKKNEWLLACGLIYAAYVRINDKIIQNTIGKKTELQDQLFQYQKGGLMKWNMVMWLNVIEESVRGEPWLVDLELKYMHNDWSTEDTSREREFQAKLGRGWELYDTVGSMINLSVMYNNLSQETYYRTWTARLKEKLESLTSG